MEKLILILTGLVCSSVVMANTVPVATERTESIDNVMENSIQITTRPAILGQWGMDIPNNKQCTEYYNFRANNEVVIKSDKEWSIGQYQYQIPNNRSEYIPSLIMHIQYDNNEKDCSGVQQDQTGDIQQFFVKWVNPEQIEFCGTEKGEKCFAVLHKQLP